MPDDNDLILWGGLGLVGAGAVMFLTQHKKPAPAGPGPGSGSGSGSGSGATGALPYAQWLRACRADQQAALRSGRYVDLLLQYAQEQYPGWWSRADIVAAMAAGRGNDVAGEWLKEFAPGFWSRSDITAAVGASLLGDVVGQYAREAGAGLCGVALANPSQGNGASTNPGTSPSGLAGTGAGTGGGKAPLSRWQDVRAGMIIALSCRYGDANYLVEPAGIGLDLMPYGYEPAHRRRRWIANQTTWNVLTTRNQATAGPRYVITLVTWACLQAVAPGPDLRWGAYRGGVGWLNGAPRIAPSAANAGYC